MTQAGAGRRFDPRWLPLIVTTIGSFMSILDSTIVNIALPSILQDFNTSLQSGQFVITSYLMALAVVVPTSGFLGERIGMKRLYMITLAFFTIGSAMCGLAWNVQSLIFFRVLQGLGGGMLQPLGMAIVFMMITPLERPHFMALLGIPALLAPMLGPTVGGYLVEYSSWRAVFLINVPIGIVDIVFAYFLLKETPLRTDTHFDFKGFGFAFFAFPCLLLALSTGADVGWDSPAALGFFAVGVVALAGFIRVELRNHDPLLRIRLFADPMFRLAIIVQWIGFFSLFGLNFLMPLFLQRAHGLGAAEAGQVLLPMGVVAFITMNTAGRQYKRFGPRPLVIVGLGVLALTTFLWSRIDENTGILPIMLVVAGRGLGLGFFGQTVQLVAYNTIAPGEIPRATSLVNVGQRINGALATAVLTTVLVASLQWVGAPAGTSISDGTAPIPLMVEAFHYAFLVMTGLCVVGMVLALFLRDRVLEEYRREMVKVPADAGQSEEPEAVLAE
ncbi:MAG TPA: MDR family MFS transporter [Tepidiformaceae bacterium]